MAYELAHLDLPMEAGSDLTAGRYKGVVLATDGQVDLCASNGAMCIGILQDNALNAAAGTAAEVRVLGVSKAIAAGSINPGVAVSVDASGKVQTAATTHYPIGFAITGATGANQYVSVLLAPSSIPRA